MCEKELVEDANFGRRPLILQPQKNHSAMAQAISKNPFAKILVVGDDDPRFSNGPRQNVDVAHPRCQVMDGEYVVS